MFLRTLHLKTGEAIELGKLTVLVGPNNVGKSQTLRDIHGLTMSGIGTRTVLVESMNIDKTLSFDDFLKSFRVTRHPTNENYLARGISSELRGGFQFEFSMDQLKNQYEAAPDLSFILGGIGRLFVSLLDASSRLLVTQTSPSYNPHNDPPNTLLQGLFSNQEAELLLADAFDQTFKMGVKLDYSGMVNLSLRVAKTFPDIPDDPRKAFPIMEQFQLLDNQGDGFRSFVGVVLSLLLSEGRVVLLDEPEAFLHPAQARRLGQWIATHAHAAKGQIIVATHNASFLSGILAGTNDVSIYRLNRAENNTSFNRIAPEATTKLSRSPVLSSQRVLEAIFHKGVVVCEADADRCVYQTVATREHDAQEILFIHAHNKQTIHQVARLLREATIPVVAIVDIDILNSSDDLRNLVNAFRPGLDTSEILEKQKQVLATVNEHGEADALEALTENVRAFLEQLKAKEHNLSGARGAVNRLYRSSTKWSAVKRRGVKALPEEQQEVATKLLDELAALGVYVVPVGELESWIDLQRPKNKWIIDALEELSAGRCPKPLKDFVEKILSGFHT